jgi:UDP-2,3-diacylglucosamine pyrophosphatase LpxH
MDDTRRKIIKLSGLTAAGLAVGGCVGSDTMDSDDGLSVALYPADSMVSYDTDLIVLKFSKPVDHQTLSGNIWLTDRTGSLMHMHTVVLDFEDVSHQSVLIKLNEDIHLKESWKYTVIVTEEVKTTLGESLTAPILLDLVTTSKSPFEAAEPVNENRTKIMVISDLHMNEQRGYDDDYSLFTENGELLVEFLEYVRLSGDIKELVILGDLMDMWVVPMAYDTFNDTITDAKDYFQSVANATVNKSVIEKINQIADEDNIHFSYVPGNHDMLFTEEIFYAIFPNGHWKGDKLGTGAYYPEPDVAFEHGHNYDLFNAPDQMTTEGSLLPPGYFITRIFATKNLISDEFIQMPTKTEAVENIIQEVEYILGWGVAVDSFSIPDFDQDKPQIVTGVDGYEQLYSPNGARDIYTKTIGPDWTQRQIQNGVYQPEPFLVGEMNGSGKFWWFGTLEASAVLQYFLPQRAKIVVFGHTHQAMIRKDLWTTYKIYANSGTWVDTKYLNEGALNRTCVVLNTSESTGSDLDNVTVYRYIGGSTLQKIGEEYLDTTL